MANQHNLACPNCKSPDRVFITVTMKVEGMLMVDGADYDCSGDFEWEDTDPSRCGNCGWVGSVADLIELKSDDEGYYTDEAGWLAWLDRHSVNRIQEDNNANPNPPLD
jgi:hypothetical protein